MTHMAKRLALRALAEGATPTLALLADLTGRPPGALMRKAKREGWAIGRAGAEDVAARIREIAKGLLDQLEALTREAAENGGKIDRERIEALMVLVRSLEKIGEVMRPEDAAKENQIRRDENLADVLDRINQRILALAGEFAKQMVAEQHRLSRGGTGGG
jgi:hypothetical protein